MPYALNPELVNFYYRMKGPRFLEFRSSRNQEFPPPRRSGKCLRRRGERATFFKQPANLRDGGLGDPSTVLASLAGNPGKARAPLCNPKASRLPGELFALVLAETAQGHCLDSASATRAHDALKPNIGA